MLLHHHRKIIKVYFKHTTSINITITKSRCTPRYFLPAQGLVITKAVFFLKVATSGMIYLKDILDRQTHG
jgi:hypothetical protein